MAPANDPETPALPNLVVVGVRKCGTTALHEYLDLHPEVQMSEPKELNFFLDGSARRSEFITEPSQEPIVYDIPTWDKGLDWYSGHFSPEFPVRGESSTAYTLPWHLGVPERMARTLDEPRVICLLRDPIERMVSHFHMFRLGGVETRSLEDALSADPNPYLASSRYSSMLRPYFERFPRSSILLVRSERLRSHPAETMREVFAFLGVSEKIPAAELGVEWNPTTEFQWSAPEDLRSRRGRLVDRARHSRVAALLRRGLSERQRERIRNLNTRLAGRARPALPPDLEGRLRERLEPEISELEALAGFEFGDWSGGPGAPSARSGA